MVEKLLTMIKSKATVTQVPAEDIASMKVGPMKFQIACYDLEGIGRMSVMEGKAMLGLMKMDTVMITPAKKDAPILSYDRILAMGNDTLIIELYDTCIKADEHPELLRIKELYAYLPDRDPGRHWYDNIKLAVSISKKGKKITEPMDSLTMEYMTEYMDEVLAGRDVDPAIKQEKNKAYVNGLLDQGGPSTDQFVKTIGKEATTDLFTRYLFGTQQ